MPIIDGRKVRARFTSLKLQEISSVDNPAQPAATASIIKRDDRGEILAPILKYINEEDGAHSFKEVLYENKFSEEIWPYTNALSQSIRSIVGDTSLSTAERETRITESVNEFLTAVREISPDVAKRLEGLISKRESTMAKTAEELQGELTKAQNALAAAEKARDDALEAKKMADEEKDKMSDELEETKKSLAEANDETMKVEGEEVRKSEVGEATFKVMKAQEARIEKAAIEKRAGDRFPSLIGSVEAKGALLKAVEGIGDAENETRKAAESILDAAEKMAMAGFERFGEFNVETEPTRKVAVEKFEGIVQKHVDEGMTRTKAMTKARQDNPDAFAAYQQAQN